MKLREADIWSAVCVECHGIGWLYGGWEVCWDCSGTGHGEDL